MENYFKSQGSLLTPYYLGLRGFIPVNSPYSNFTWQDGSRIRPPEKPSSLAELSSAPSHQYVHWGGCAQG